MSDIDCMTDCTDKLEQITDDLILSAKISSDNKMFDTAIEMTKTAQEINDVINYLKND